MAEKPQGKVFCIGMNKTGTTSLEKFMELHGFTTGDQVRGELLLRDFMSGNFGPILDFCKTADFFQDLPFNAPGCFKILLTAYPDAKYILTVRDSADEWYESLVGFHQKVFGAPLTKELLQKTDYRYRGFAWDANRALYQSPEEAPYERESLIDTYEHHYFNVLKTFGRSENLLVLNLKEKDAVEKLSEFLGIKPKVEKMPWLNKTADA